MDVNLGVFLLLAGLITSNGQSCDNNKLRRCREQVGRYSSRRPNELSRSDCREFRENFNCLLDQSGACIYNEEDRETYGREIMNAHNSLMESCDEKEEWNRNRCYQKDEINRCERDFPRRISGANSENCRKYEELRDCVERIVNNYCSHSDKTYLNSYYVSIGRRLPWQCRQLSTSSSPGYPGGSYRPGGDNVYGNRSYDNDKRCCRSEQCEDRDRALNCRQDLIKFVEGRSNIASYDKKVRCTTFLNKFNCMLWHMYNCQQSHEKSRNDIDNAKSYIQSQCDVNGDLRTSRCYEDYQIRDCERYLEEETPSRHDVTCREYASYYDCFERQLRRCTEQEELLQGFYLLSKVDDKAWMCSKRDSSVNGFTPHDDRTRPYSDPYGVTNPQEEKSCEIRASRDHHRCVSERIRMDDEARRVEDNRERRIKNCCVAYKYRECTREVVRENCEREWSNVVHSLMGSESKLRLDQCQDINQSACSASRMISNAIFIVLAVAAFRSIFEH